MFALNAEANAEVLMMNKKVFSLIAILFIGSILITGCAKCTQDCTGEPVDGPVSQTSDEVEIKVVDGPKDRASAEVQVIVI